MDNIEVLNDIRTYALTGSTKYGVWVSGILTWFFDDFWAIPSERFAIAIDRKLIAKSLKRRIFVHAHDGEFVQCVSPRYMYSFTHLSSIYLRNHRLWQSRVRNVGSNGTVLSLLVRMLPADYQVLIVTFCMAAHLTPLFFTHMKQAV